MSDLEKLIDKSGTGPVTEGEVEFSTTGLWGLDWALGGGIARGRIIEFFGLESSGKSTIGLQAAIAEAERTGLPALWCDYEYAWDGAYVSGLGADDGQMMVAQPETIEDGFELAKKAISEGWVSSVWFDSTGVMESSEKGVATRARAMSQGVPSLIRVVAEGGVVCGFISQTREVISTGFGSGWGQGPRRKATGGAAIKFAFSQRVEFTHKGKLKGKAYEITGKESDQIIGRRVIAKVMKNKVGVPWREAEFDLIDGIGFDRMRHLIELGVELGIIAKKGGYFEVPGIARSVQGLQNLTAVLRDRRATQVVADLEEMVRKALEKKDEGVEKSADTGDDQEVDDGNETVDEG